jgi:hypothetical protein
MSPRKKTTPQSNNGHPGTGKPSNGAGSLRAAILDDFSALRLPISGDDLDGALRERKAKVCHIWSSSAE